MSKRFLKYETEEANGLIDENGCLNNCIVTRKEFNDLRENGGSGITGFKRINDGGKNEYHAIISFTDDDCRSEVYTTLFPLIKELELPYTIACPTSKIGKELFITKEQLLEMYEYGVTVSCHTKNETNMDTVTTDELNSILTEYHEIMNDWGISDVKSYAYCQGKYTVENVQIVKKFFDMGFTVTKGINTIPYESYYMKRVGLFPRGGNFTLEDAKTYVDELVLNGGWLIFMTHSWFEYDDGTKTFNEEEFRELVSYIRGLDIPILDVNEVIEKTGNVVEVGHFKKNDLLNGHYFVVDSTGNMWSDVLRPYSDEEKNEEEITLTYQTGYCLGKETSTSYKGLPLALSSGDVKYVICEAVEVTDCESVLISGWSYSGYGIYSFLDANGDCVAGVWATNSVADGGDILTEEKVEIPEGACTLIIAGHTEYTVPALTKIYNSMES